MYKKEIIRELNIFNDKEQIENLLLNQSIFWTKRFDDFLDDSGPFSKLNISLGAKFLNNLKSKYLSNKSVPINLFPWLGSNNTTRGEYLKAYFTLTDFIDFKFFIKNYEDNQYSDVTTELNFGQKLYLNFTLATLFLAYFQGEDRNFKRTCNNQALGKEMSINAEIHLRDNQTGECRVTLTCNFFNPSLDRGSTNVTEVQEYVPLYIDLDVFYGDNPFGVYTNFDGVPELTRDFYEKFCLVLSKTNSHNLKSMTEKESSSIFFMLKCLAYVLTICEWLEEEYLDLKEDIEYSITTMGEISFKINENYYIFDLYGDGDKDNIYLLSSFNNIEYSSEEKPMMDEDFEALFNEMYSSVKRISFYIKEDKYDDDNYSTSIPSETSQIFNEMYRLADTYEINEDLALYFFNEGRKNYEKIVKTCFKDSIVLALTNLFFATLNKKTELKAISMIADIYDFTLKGGTYPAYDLYDNYCSKDDLLISIKKVYCCYKDSKIDRKEWYDQLREILPSIDIYNYTKTLLFSKKFASDNYEGIRKMLTEFEYHL